MVEYIFTDDTGKKPIEPDKINDRTKLKEEGIDLEGFPTVEETNGGYNLIRNRLPVSADTPFKAHTIIIGTYTRGKNFHRHSEKPYEDNEEIGVFYVLGSDFELRMNLGQRSLCIRE